MEVLQKFSNEFRLQHIALSQSGRLRSVDKVSWYRPDM
jgi:hypothetical protein